MADGSALTCRSATGWSRRPTGRRRSAPITIQVFTDNPTAWRRRAEPPRELEAFRERLDEHRIRPVISHASYLINPAGPPTEVWDRSLGLLISELEVAPTFGVGFVNVHIGSHLGAGVEAGIAQAAEAAARALTATQSTERPIVLLLENSVGSGDGVGVDPVELGAILAAAEQRGADPARLGSASTPPMPGEPVTTSAIRGGSMPCSRRSIFTSGSARPTDPPQRLARGARQSGRQA